MYEQVFKIVELHIFIYNDIKCSQRSLWSFFYKREVIKQNCIIKSGKTSMKKLWFHFVLSQNKRFIPKKHFRLLKNIR